jgi:hypothetical protein
MTLAIDEEVMSMATLTEAVLQEGIEIGTVTTLVNNVKSLMRNLECGVDCAMDILAVEGPTREVVAEKVMLALTAN